MKNNETIADQLAKTQEELNSYKALFNNTFNQASVGMVQASPDGALLRVNNKFCEIIGYPREEALKLTIEDITHPDDIGMDHGFMKKTRSGEIDNYSMEKRYIRKDGSIVWVNIYVSIIRHEDGKTKYATAVVTDLSDIKNAERKLEESHDRYALAMDATQDGIFDWNLVTNQIYYSPNWKKMLGYEDHELPNDFSIWETLTEPEDVKKSWEMQQELINKKRDRFVMEFKMKHKDGHWVDILSRADAFFDKSGKAIRVVGTHVDISDRKKMLSKLE
ncbi:MAG: PAS domain S-box protein, partial [Halieaceae bacterium]|nr:PAS domain S-box protein [Halieaceae bacterium]